MSKKLLNASITLWETKTLDDFTPELSKDLFERAYGDNTVAVSRFMENNRAALDFLGIESNVDGNRRLHLVSSRYGGVVPLRTSGLKSKEILLSVRGRYGEDATELLPLLGGEFEPEFEPALRLPCESPVQPPIYLECFKLVNQYLRAEQARWQKFDVVEREDPYVAGLTNWAKYAQRTVRDPMSSLRFPNRRNILSRNHLEQQQVNYALGVALEHLAGASLSPALRAANDPAVNRATGLLRQRPAQPCRAVALHASDTSIIAELKRRANNVLSHSTAERSAWRIDYAEFFERYVQYVCRQAARQVGMSARSNVRIPIRGQHTCWGLAYLEPDVVIGNDIIADAKYKGHMTFGAAQATILAEEFRHDLHQVLAYAGITGAKRAMLVYPAAECRQVLQRVEDISISLIGLPIGRAAVSDAISFMTDRLIL